MTDPLDTFPAFVAAVRDRLETGRTLYGDRSFDRAPAELLGEIEQELFDVCGWSFCLWERIRRMRGAAEGVRALPLDVDPAPAPATRVGRSRMTGAGLTHRPARGAPGPAFAVGAGPDVEFAEGVAQLAATGARYGIAPYSYAWTVASGGTGAFDDDSALDAVFTPDDDSEPSVLRLTATDDTGATASDTLSATPPEPAP